MREKALLIVPPTGKYIREDRCQTPIEEFQTIALRPPIALMYLAAVLEQKGVACLLKDYPAEDVGWEGFRRDLGDFLPDMLIVSMTTPSLEKDVEACRIAKSEIPHCLTVGKGAHFNFSDLESLAKYPELDVVLRGEYEQTIGELAHAEDLSSVAGISFQYNGVPMRNADRPLIDDLDQLPYPARHLSRNDLYIRPDTGAMQTTVVTSRGCPSKCVFCLAPVISGSKVRRRSPENIVGELKECVEQHGIRSFLFRSDLFTAHRSWVMELCQLIIEENLQIEWSCNSRVDTIDRERLKAMKEAGCWLIAFGVETGSEDMLQHMRKNASLERARDAIRLCRQQGIKSSVYMLVGLPWETEESFKQTADFAVELSPDFLEVFYAYPFQGTELYEIALREGLLEPGQFPVDSYSRPAIPSLNFSIEQLSHMRRQMLRRFYLRPGYILRTLARTRSPKVFASYVKYGTRQLVDLLTKT